MAIGDGGGEERWYLLENHIEGDFHIPVVGAANEPGVLPTDLDSN